MTTLSSFVDATTKIDGSVKSLHDELTGLSSVVDAVSSSLRSPRVQDIIESDVSCELRTSINQSLESCRATVQKLEDVLKSATKNGHSSMQPNVQVQLNTDEGTIKTIRAQIHTHHMNLSMSLVMIDL